ncbi:MAG: ABC transporter ATP-binding protein [Clostridia bacterium]|nr:ABC transporter ATP-binding protein [Clostridia bacterium]
MSNNKPQIKCNNLALGYDGRVVAEDISFEVVQGDYLCIVGENGAGKSTLIKTLLKLNLPMGGKLEMDGELARGGIGYLPQQTEVQKDFPASVREIVLSGCIKSNGFRPFYSKSQKQLACDSMKKLGIDNLANCSYRELSGGQQQRVLLARALCASQKILLLDEPAAGLDPVATAEMYAVIEELNKSGITIVMVSHDVAAAMKYAKHILHISHKLLFFGSVADYRVSNVGKAFLGGGDAQ